MASFITKLWKKITNPVRKVLRKVERAVRPLVKAAAVVGATYYGGDKVGGLVAQTVFHPDDASGGPPLPQENIVYSDMGGVLQSQIPQGFQYQMAEPANVVSFGSGGFRGPAGSAGEEIIESGPSPMVWIGGGVLVLVVLFFFMRKR